MTEVKHEKSDPHGPQVFHPPKPPSDPVTRLEGVHFHQTQRSGAYQHHTLDLLGEVGSIYAMVKTAIVYGPLVSPPNGGVSVLTASPNMGLYIYI